MLPLLYVIIAIVFSIFLLVVLSDHSTRYKIISVIFLLTLIVFEYLHLLSPDPTNGIDVATHVFLGIALYGFLNNLKFLPKNSRPFLGIIFVAVIVIIFEFLQPYLGFGSYTLDMVEDILYTTIGGTIGVLVFIAVK
jgi:hypothetical protein